MAQAYSSGPRPAPAEAKPPSSGANALVATAIVVTALYVGRDVFVPFVLAALLSFVLAAPIKVLQDIGLGRAFPVAAVVVVAFMGIAATGVVVTTQLAQLAGDLPRYQSTMRDKIGGLKEAASGNRALENVAGMLQNLSREIGFDAPEPAPPRPADQAAKPADQAAKPPEQRPIPVEIAGTRATPMERIVNFVTPLLHPLATAGLVVIFVVFILLQRGDLRNRLIRLAGSKDLQRTTAALTDAVRRLSRFFITQVLLNSVFGVVVGIGLWLIGVPSPILWGILAGISRFIPYVGVVLAAGGPLILAAAVDPHWSMLLWTLGFFAAMEFFVGQVVEPLLYGHSTGLSPIAVIASVTFWTLLWGPVGLLLATPLTVCLVVLGRHVEQLEFLDVMFGDRPPLTLTESFYQRVLAGDAGEVSDQAEAFLKHHRLVTYYDQVAIPGLALAQGDVARGAVDDARLARMTDTIAEITDDLSDHEDEAPEPDLEPLAQPLPEGDDVLERELKLLDAEAAQLSVLDRAGAVPVEGRGPGSVLCVAGRNGLDRAAAIMLSQLLEKQGVPARAEGHEVLTAAGIGGLDPATTGIVCLSYLDSSAPVHVRYAVRRVRRRLPQATIVFCAWGVGTANVGELCQASRADHCAGRLIDAVRICLVEADTREAAPAATDPNPAPLLPASGEKSR